MQAATTPTRRVLWMTDIHLEFLLPDQITTFLGRVKSHEPDVVLISGDIGQAKPLRSFLLHMSAILRIPILFVLGNHDFYGGDIATVRAEMQALTSENPGLVWLPAVDLVELAPGVGLIGHDGWADGRYGDYERSQLILNDYAHIKSFVGLSKAERLTKMRSLADDSADYLRRILPRALTHYQHIFIMIHPPPFLETFYHKGKPVKSSNPFVPHFTSKAIGDVLYETAKSHSSHTFTVLCGHTHGAANVQITHNLSVMVGGAEYHQPEVQRVFEFEIET